MKKLLFTALIAGSLLNISCKKDASEAPLLPPKSSMSADFSNFQESGKTDSSSIDTTKFDHWGRAAIQVTVWNIIIGLNMALPVAAFNEAHNQTPEYVSKKEGWLWSFSVTEASGTYTCNLYGKFVGESIEWRMLISKAGSFTDVEWYTGISKTDGTGGSWSVNKNAFNVTKYLDIAWTKVNSDVDVKFTLVEAGVPENGSYINYKEQPSASFDRAYDIYLAKENQTVNLLWNKDTKDGKAKDPAHYGDNDYRCWDAALQNTVCN